MPATPSPSRSMITAALALAIVAGACTSSDSDDAATDETSSTTTTSDSTVATEPLPTSGLDGAIGQASDLVLGWFNGSEFDEATFDSSFDETFRGAISYAELAGIVEQVLLDAPVEVVEIADSTDTQVQLLIVGASGMEALLSLTVTSAEDPTIAGFFIGSAEPPAFDAPSSTTEALERLGAMGTLRAGVFDDACVPVALNSSIRIGEQSPIGSAFKLWVLDAVVDAVAAGSISWDDDVEVRDELDSHPSGITQDDEPGTVLTVRTMAERMIEISDNTATNHLMDLVGRAAVERAMIESGHSEPSRNLPMMNAREFTIVKFGDAELRDRYIAADEAERRRILDEEVASLPLPAIADITSVTGPIEVETLEWFASPTDLCRTLTELATDGEATAILSRSPGIPDEAGRWDAVLFKGGSEPGVIAMAWLVVDSAGERFVIAGGVANEDQLIDEFEAASLLAYVRDTAVPS